jgi:hypothetical protein
VIEYTSFLGPIIAGILWPILFYFVVWPVAGMISWIIPEGKIKHILYLPIGRSGKPNAGHCRHPAHSIKRKLARGRVGY